MNVKAISSQKKSYLIACMANILLYLHVDCGHDIIPLLVLLRSLGCRLGCFRLQVHILIAVQAGAVNDTPHVERHLPASLKQTNNGSLQSGAAQILSAPTKGFIQLTSTSLESQCHMNVFIVLVTD